MTVKAADVIVRGVKDFLDGNIFQNASEGSELL